MKMRYLVRLAGGEERDVEFEKPAGFHPDTWAVYEAACQAAEDAGLHVIDVQKHRHPDSIWPQSDKWYQRAYVKDRARGTT